MMPKKKVLKGYLLLNLPLNPNEEELTSVKIKMFEKETNINVRHKNEYNFVDQSDQKLVCSQFHRVFSSVV